MTPKASRRPPGRRCRVRDLGLKIGRFPTGRWNAITDVANVFVGHSTIIRGSGALKPGSGPVRTGVTAILPNAGNVYLERVAGAGFVLNGAGELSGLTQVVEWGLIETPILLTNSLSVGTCSDAVVNYMVQRYPGMGVKHDVVLPLVGECDDSWLNDIAGRHVRSEHVFQAIADAKTGPVLEGCVGGGTGMITCDLKGGIGSSSRRVKTGEHTYTIGVLVMTNFGVLEDLRVDGIQAGRLLANRLAHLSRRRENYGSIIAVLATDAPLLPHHLQRLAKRVALGIGRTGSYAAHGSGEIVLAFSNANAIPRKHPKMLYRMKILLDDCMDPLYEATIHATEEAILNAMCMATDMTGADDHFVPALPLEPLAEIIAERNAALKGA